MRNTFEGLSAQDFMSCFCNGCGENCPIGHLPNACETCENERASLIKIRRREMAERGKDITRMAREDKLAK